MKTSYGVEKCTNPYEVMTASDLSHDAFRLTSQDAVRVTFSSLELQTCMLSFSPNQYWGYFQAAEVGKEKKLLCFLAISMEYHNN